MLKPLIEGKAGSAWKAVITDEQHRQSPAALDMWLLHLPEVNPVWSWFVVSGCSLQDFPELSPAIKTVENATHEFSVFALDPAFFIDEMWLHRYGRCVLYPPNLNAQFTDLRDADANQLIFDLVYGFCHGVLNPDRDFSAINLGYMRGTVRSILRSS